MKAVPERADDQAVAPARAPAAQHGDGPPPARGRLDPHALRRLQAGAGNAAVSRLVAQRAAQPVQRLASGLPEAPAKTQPQDDPRFRAAAGEIRAKGRALAGHPPPAAEARAAQDAAVAPADDREAQAKAAQVGRMDAAKPGAFDKAAFVAAVERAVAAQAPKNLDEAESFASSGRADGIRSQVLGQVTAGRQASARDVAERAAEPPDPSRVVDRPVTALPERPAAVAPPAPDPAAMAVAPAPPPQTDLSATPQRTDATMAGSGLTPAQLAASNEPQFESALAAKQAADHHAATAPAALRAAEQQKVAAERSAASALGAAGMQGMAAARTTTGAHVTAGQAAAKARDEEARAKVSAELKAVYDGTKADVDKLLADLDGQVGAAFDQGEAQAKAAFTADHQARMQRYKDERYAGVSGAARWVADKFTGLPAEAGQIFQLARALYESRMRAVISDVADLIGRQLNAAKARIARGREETAGIVARQPRELQRFAADAAREFGGRFAELDSAVDDKSKALVDDLAQRYTAARSAVDDEIKALQAENKGLLDAAMDALAETAATVKQLADLLAGVASRAAGAVQRIIAKPIEFLGHLVDAVKSGVLGFAARAGEHLKQGLKDWLLGRLAAGGIELPETLDAKGILKLVLSVLGLTWANIRARVVRQIPEPAMRALEGSFEMVRVLMTEGVGGLWRWILGKLGDLKDTVIGAIKDFVLEKIVTAGVTWIVSLLNPASAFARACKAIYDVIMFFVHQAARLKDFVNTVLDSIEGIAAGAGGGIPAKIEAALAKALPLVLDFLASLLGLGGISEKIRGILEKVQAPVTKAVDWVIGKIVAAGKSLLGRARSKAQGEDTPEGKQRRLDRGVDAAARLLGRVSGSPVGIKAIPVLFAGIKSRYGMTELVPAVRNGAWSVRGAVNPTKSVDTSSAARMALDVSDIEFGQSTPTVAQVWMCGEFVGTFRSGGGLHAEQRAIAAIRAKGWTGIREWPVGRVIRMDISRSPCGPGVPDLADNRNHDCAHALQTAAREQNARLTLRLASLYEGRDHQAGQSVANIQMLLEEGHRVEPWNILEEINKGRHGKLTMESLTPEVRGRLARKAEIVNEAIDAVGGSARA